MVRLFDINKWARLTNSIAYLVDKNKDRKWVEISVK